MKILKLWNEHPETLKDEGLPIGWHEVTEEEVLKHTEKAGYYKKGTVINALKNGAQIRTMFAFYKMEE